ncbi:asparagine synthase (glutamine-hydrolyzing) [Yoonia sp. R2-816]|uniref:asparagine synthase (glutamine-hydrolyzing) n=1 Tax=Yoonia sp. R2-816 TaxID=3342638 RepID=UPI0037266D9C
MCGIVGVYSRDGSEPHRKMEAALRQMTDQIVHRGPDGSGTWVNGKIGFGHRRLAIIDLNERAAQPMHTADGALTVTFNGEIYNFKDLRRELESQGHVFRTESDTEVLLHGYRQWGMDLPSRLRGMFAFAIWDEAKQELFMVRDRFGKKPFVYAWSGQTFVFGSEAKSLLEWPGFERHVDLAVIHDYLSYGYTLGARTAFAGLNRLPPAHMMLLTPTHGPENPPVPLRYWELAQIDEGKADMTKEAAAGEFLERFDEALRLRLVSDVPLGAFLSGGVDSSAVVARMSGLLNEPIKTFSVGFDIGGFDETEYANEVATQYKTDHHSFKMDYSLIETLPKTIWHYGEPYSDSSALVSTALSHKIREHVTVALSGDGGDEILLGYSRYNRFTNEVTQLQAGSAVNDPHNHHDLAFGPPTVRDRYLKYIATFRDLHKQWGYGHALMDCYLTPSADRLPALLENVTPGVAADHAARAEVETYLPDDLLIKADIATMTASLEGRSPFLDHELADWCASLPQHLRVFERNGQLEMKALLKYAMEPQLSHNILYRKKQGFSVPVKHWIRNEIRELTGDLLTSKAFLERGYLRPEFVYWMLDRHFSEREDHGTRIWCLLCLELWHQTFFERRGPGPMPLSINSQTKMAS